MCTYNGVRYIEEQLKSILRQSVPVNEVIICDDRSTDNTVQLIRSLIQEQKLPVKIFVNDVNLGIKKNFEKALRTCTGEIILLADQDDIWEYEKVKKIQQYFEQHSDKNVVFTNANLLDNGVRIPDTAWDKRGFHGNEKEVLKDPSEMLRQLLLKWNIATGATMAVRKSALARFLPFSDHKNYHHDHLLALEAAAENSLGFIDECLITYRMHAEQQIGFRKRKVPTFLQPPYRLLQKAKKKLLKRKRLEEKKLIAGYLLKLANENFPEGKNILEAV